MFLANNDCTRYNKHDKYVQTILKKIKETQMGKTLIKETIHAKGVDIGVYTTDFENKFISLTDIAKYWNEDDLRLVIQNWMCIEIR